MLIETEIMKNNIEIDIYRAIDMAFHWFKKNNPKLESICDKEIMDQWYNFITWCYAQDGDGAAEDVIKSDDNFDFEISPLMGDAMDECSGWWCKYNVDHQEIAEEEYRGACDNCNGTGYMDEDYENECEECEGTGKDQEDEESHWEAYEEAFSNVADSVNTDNFAELSKIKL